MFAQHSMSNHVAEFIWLSNDDDGDKNNKNHLIKCQWTLAYPMDRTVYNEIEYANVFRRQKINKRQWAFRFKQIDLYQMTTRNFCPLKCVRAARLSITMSAGNKIHVFFIHLLLEKYKTIDLTSDLPNLCVSIHLPMLNISSTLSAIKQINFRGYFNEFSQCKHSFKLRAETCNYNLHGLRLQFSFEFFIVCWRWAPYLHMFQIKIKCLWSHREQRLQSLALVIFSAVKTTN